MNNDATYENADGEEGIPHEYPVYYYYYSVYLR